MSIHCINPSCYQGDPGNPPEFESDNSIPCIHCGKSIDLDDDDCTMTSDGGYLCDACLDESEE